MDREKRAYAIFSAALALEPSQRAGYATTECAGDDQLLGAVRELLAADEVAESEGFLLSPRAPADFSGAVFGEFRLVRVIARGGMGTVYEAEQANPRRKVAVKVLDPASCTGSMLRRFEVEAEVLARLSHPSIARVIASGVKNVESGPIRIDLPWLAMELLESARPVTSFVAERQLPLDRRLAMFRRICDAVEYAHGNGIIHRDIKPGNVLVDARGDVKLIDFGIAHRLNQARDSNPLITQRGEILGTLRYMAPEQFRGELGVIDARSDVYALGVLLCEMLTEKPPLDPSGVSLTRAAEIVSTTQPTAPSKLASQIPRAIDAIVLKAIEKEPARRYANVSLLAEDIRRYLADEPLLAAPPSRRGEITLFVKRHRVAVVAAGAILVALIAGLVGTMVALRRARDAEQQARDEGLVSAQLVTLFKSAFDEARPENKGTDLRVVDILDSVAKNGIDALSNRPTLAASLVHQLGLLYVSLGASEQAESLFERALARLEEVGEAETLDGVRVLDALAETRMRASKFDAARIDLERASRIAADVAEPDDPLLATLLHRRGALAHRQRDFAAAEPLYREAALRRERIHGRDHVDTLSSLNSLNVTLQDLGRLDEAEPLATEVATRLATVLGDDHPATLMARNNLATLLFDRNKIAEAIAELEWVYALQARKLDADHPDILVTRTNIARYRIRGGDRERGFAQYAELVPVYEKRFGLANQRTVQFLSSYADFLSQAGAMPQAESLLLGAIARLAEADERDARAIGGLKVGYANALFKAKRFQDAAAEARAAYDLLKAVVGEDYGDTKRAKALAATAEKASAGD